MAVTHPDRHQSTLAALVNTTESLVCSALAPSTRRAYHRNMEQFSVFVRDHCPQSNHFPADSGMVALFIAHLYNAGKTTATITSTLAAVSYLHKLYGYTDPTSHFIIKKMLVGVAKSRPGLDLRYPITLQILNSLVRSCQYVTQSCYYSQLFSALYSLSFNAFLRPGEVTQSVNNLQFSQVSINEQSVSIRFLKFKHYHGKHVTIVVHRNLHPSCPVKTLSSYVQSRGKEPGPLFCHPTLSPVTHSELSQTLSMSTKWASCHNLGVRPHSFRIGAATHAASLGYSEEHICRMGRWHSNSFKRYIRIPTFDSKLC